MGSVAKAKHSLKCTENKTTLKMKNKVVFCYLLKLLIANCFRRDVRFCLFMEFFPFIKETHLAKSNQALLCLSNTNLSYICWRIWGICKKDCIMTNFFVLHSLRVNKIRAFLKYSAKSDTVGHKTGWWLISFSERKRRDNDILCQCLQRST